VAAIIRRAEPFDALVVGSGMNGGVAAKQLCEAGLRTLVLEAGPTITSRNCYGSPAINLVRGLYAHFITGRQHVQERHPTYWQTSPRLFVDDTRHAYSTPQDKPFRWIRGRQVGGRSHVWGAGMLRLSDHEFKAASRDGIGNDWPIDHADLDPYYGLLERFFHARGHRDGVPQLPDGIFVAASAMSPGERVMKSAVEGRFPERRVIISRGLKAKREPAPGERFSRRTSIMTTLAAALATGKLTLQSDATVTRVIVTPGTRRARGVQYIDHATGEQKEVEAKLVFLCASTIESVRILMNSRNREQPEGLGASSGVLGKYLMDHVVGVIYFYMPEVRGGTYDLTGSDSILIPRFQNLADQCSPYLRGFGYWGAVQRLHFPPFLRKKGDAAIGFLSPMCEMLPNAENSIRLDHTKRDEWGEPVPFISCSWGPNEMKLAQAARAAAEEMIAAAGGIVVPLTELVRTPLVTGILNAMHREWLIGTPGLGVHEVGGARMGTDSATSVVNPFCQVWDSTNVFVTDGACWVSSGWQNPTLTEMAITARACAYAVEQLRRGDL
jgi:choline dehydrogenase-like flavoprotein